MKKEVISSKPQFRLALQHALGNGIHIKINAKNTFRTYLKH